MIHRIGVLFGVEHTFPGALVDRINSSGVPGISAEFVKIGGVQMAAPSGYRIIVDRVSHDIPFYRAFLKHAALDGTVVINNPFWSGADDRFFDYALAAKLGVAIPPTVILPHKEHPPNTTAQSMRNLAYPIDWDEVFAHIGFPAILRPLRGGGRKDVSQVRDQREFFDAYDRSRDLCMILQRAVNVAACFRCYVVGQQHVHIMPYDPWASPAERYLAPPAGDPALLARVERDALTLCRALGQDFHMVEFAVQDGVPYAIDLADPVPDADVHVVGRKHFEWIVDAVADRAVRKALEPVRPPELRWGAFLSGGTVAGA